MHQIYTVKKQVRKIKDYSSHSLDLRRSSFARFCLLETLENEN
jgi:hypothetical protein